MSYKETICPALILAHNLLKFDETNDIPNISCIYTNTIYKMVQSLVQVFSIEIMNKTRGGIAIENISRKRERDNGGQIQVQDAPA